MKPYIGITGFMTRQEVESILNVIPENPSRLLMVGVLASLKTLRYETNKWVNRYPKGGKIQDIFTDDPRTLNLILYNTKEPENLLEQLLEMTDLGGPNFQGFQLNLAWPSVPVLREYRKRRGYSIVLQIGSHAYEMVHFSPQELANLIAIYEGLVDYVLLDQSGGHGLPFDTEKARKCLEAIMTKNLSIGLGVAGGLSPLTLNLVEPLLSDFSDLSIDAEGRLRDKDDNLDIEVAKEYVLKSLGVPWYKVCPHTLEQNWPLDSDDYNAHTTCEGDGRCKWVVIPKN